MESLAQDLRFHLRAIARRPGTTVVAVLSLAIGIGANSAVFGVVDGMFLRPWSVESPDELVWVRHRALEGQGDSMSYADYLDVRDQNTVFSGLVAESRRGGMLAVDGEAELVLVNAVSENFFEVLGVDAVLGRVFSPSLDADTSDPGVVLSHALWTRRFGQDPSIIGRTIDLTGARFPVVGVAPPTFRGLTRMLSVDVWVPPAAWVVLSNGSRSEFDHRGTRQFDVLGRLRPGSTPASAEAQLATIAQRLSAAYPDTNRDRTFGVVSERSERRARGLTMALLLMAVVGLVLLIACANVATLVLADAEARHRETAVRRALGAGRWRLARQSLTESGVIAALAMAAGLLVAFGLLQVVPALMPPGEVPISPDLRLDHRVLLVTVAASMVTLLLFGLSPALHSSRRQIVTGLKADAPRVEGRPGLLSARHLLVIVQMALCVALMTGAGLLVRSFLSSRAIAPGFDSGQDMVIALVARSRTERAPTPVWIADLADAVRALPGVHRVTWARRIGMSTSGGGATRRIEVAGQAPLSVKYNQVAPDYFEVMGTRILRGRPFDTADHADAAPVVMVNELLAGRLWPGGDPLDRIIRAGTDDYRVVAVVENGKVNALHEDPEPFVYFSYAQVPSGDTTLLVATDGAPALVAGPIRQLLREREARVLNLGVLTLDEHMRRALYDDRMPAQIGGALGVLGVLLAAVGLYGVMARLVTRRQRELGIRMALGARRSQVIRLVLGHGLRLSLAGIALGVGLALGVGRLMASSLHGVSWADPSVLAGSGLIVVVVGLAASHLPTLRATRIDPARVLRSE